jgi:hypothetical protein
MFNMKLFCAISNQQIRDVLLKGRTLESNKYDTKVQSTQRIA